MIGRMRDRVTFQGLDAATDNLGNVTDATWSDIVTVWGQFTPDRARERLEAGRNESQVQGVLKVRSSPETQAVTAADRVLIDAIPYQIRGIMNEDRRDRFLSMIVERGVG